MPVYSSVTIEMLNEWKAELIEGFRKFYDNPSQDLLCYLILKLFEFIQCLAKLSIENVNELTDVKITLKDIKSYMNSSDYNKIINILFGVRNSIAHDLNEKSVQNMLSLVKSDAFINFLKEFGLDNKLIDNIERAIDVVVNFDDIKAKCHSECSQRINEARGRKLELGKILHAIYNSYPKFIVDTCVLDILSNDILTC